MCGRFALTEPVDAMAQMFDAVPGNDLMAVPNYNVCPTNAVPVVTSDQGRRIQSMRWGFLPHWYQTPTSGPLLINARAETIAQKPAFRDACRARRCLIPATGFYEWTKDAEGARDPWYIFRTNGAPLVFAGVWQDWEQQGVQMRTCAIVTCAAVTPMTALHHRQPVILEPEAWPLWLGEAGHGAARLMRPLGAEALGFHRVGRAVNSNRAAGPELIVAQDQARSEAPTRR